MVRLPYYAHSYVVGSMDEVLRYPDLSDYWVYGVVEKGCCSLRVNGQLRTSRGISMFVLAPRQKIADCICSPDCRCVAVITYPNDLCSVFDHCMHGEHNHIGKQCYAMSHTFLSMSDDFAERWSVYKRLLLYTMRYFGKGYRKYELDNCLRMLFTEMLCAIDSAMESNTSASRVQMVFLAFCSMVESECCVHRQVGWYAQRLSITSNRLTKICCVEGMSPSEIIAFVTMRQIRRVLCDTEMTIKEIAAQFHFDTTDALCRFFQSQMSMSPMQYRAQYLQSAYQ